MDLAEVKSLLEKQGEAFEAFKSTLAEEQKKADAVTAEKLGKIEKSLDDAVEAKTALEVKLDAEVKFREEFEAKLNRANLGHLPEHEAKAALELKSFNNVLASAAADRKRSFAPLNAEAYGEYKAAFDHWVREGDRSLSAEEVKTLSVGSDPDGGYFVTPDMSGRVVQKVYETSPMRQICAVQVISTDALQGVEDTGEAGAGYAGEQAQGSDSTTPQIGKWEIPVFWLDTEPKATQQLLDDAEIDVEAWLGGKVGNKLGRFENSEFVNGVKIRGLVAGNYTFAVDSGAGVTWGQVGYVASGASGDFAASAPADKIYDLIGCVKDQYLNNSRFLTRRSVITKIRKFKDGQNNYLWQPSFVLGTPETILGYPLTRAEDMPALTANSLSLAFGDFREAYQIVDRTGIRVLRDPYTAKPFVKFYTTKRTGGGVINYEAYKVMKFA